jgi:hypothetical protein
MVDSVKSKLKERSIKNLLQEDCINESKNTEEKEESSCKK